MRMRLQPVFQPIVFGSADYRQECELRQRVLRIPLGLNLYNEDLGPEKDQLHFGLFDEAHVLIACVIALPLGAGKAKIRQMAVAPEHQGRGHGRILLQSAEALLAERSVRELCLHARKTAVPFYERLGYRTSGPEFLEVGIPHIAMEKHLARESGTPA